MPFTEKFCVWPTLRLASSGVIRSCVRTGVAVAVGCGVNVRVAVGAVGLGVGVGASTTCISALSPVVSELMPVPGSVTEMIAVPTPTASTLPGLSGAFGGKTTLRLLELVDDLLT